METVGIVLPFLFLGLLAGVISGTLGVGSGALLVPALVILFNTQQKSAQGIALTVMVPMALIGAIRYKINPDIEVDMTSVCIISIGAVVGVFFGTILAGKIPAYQLKRIFAIFLFIISIKMFFTKSPANKVGGSEDKIKVTEAIKNEIIE